MKVLIVSNMYPNKRYPSAGIFVKRFCDELKKLHIDYEKSVMLKRKTAFGKVYGYCMFYLVTSFRILLNRYDIVYIHYASHSSAPVMFARKVKRFRIFTNVHGSDVVPENARQEKFQKYTVWAIKNSEKVIVPSEYFKEYVVEKYGVDSNKIVVYPSSGVDRTIFKKANTEKIDYIKNQYGLNKNNKTFSYVGRISSQKGWDTYLRAISILVRQGYDANYIVVGDGTEIHEYENMIKKLELSDKVIKLPLLLQENLVEIYNCSDAFIFPTEREGESLGLVSIEAMSCGTPVIASNYAAPKYYIVDEYNGLKFTAGKEKELAAKMMGFINGDYEKDDFSEGVEKTAEQYSNKNILQGLRDIF